MEIQIQNLSFNLSFNPAIFFSAGEALNDKDRDLNIDSLQIQNFFKPIDNLFGDYEVMKKFDYHQNLYLKGINNRVFKLKLSNKHKIYNSLSKDDYPIEPKYKHKDLVFVFYLYLNGNDYTYVLEVEEKKRNKLHLIKTKEISAAKKEMKDNLNLLQIFALDPEKLIQCANYDLIRFKHHVELMAINEQITKKNLYEFLQIIYEKRKSNVSSNLIVDFFKFKAIEEFLSYWGLDVTNDDYFNIVKCFMSRKYKFKNYERHEYFKARLGKENGQFVLFLHPYESESNNPVRFPPGGQ